MKNELILSSLILAAQVSPTAQASAEIQQELKRGVQETVIKTPLLKLDHPFKQGGLEAYATITVSKSNYEVQDLNLARVTHHVTIKLFDRNNQEIKDFIVDDSEDGGYYFELRGTDNKGRKSYVMWSCSSTMNCGFDAPGFFHIYPQDNGQSYFYMIELPVGSYEGEGGAWKTGRMNLNFTMNKDFIR